MKRAIYVVELRKVQDGQAETLLATAHPEVVEAVLQAWERILRDAPEPAGARSEPEPEADRRGR